jgi:hypothetical protein
MKGMRKRRWWLAGLILALLAACVGVWKWSDRPLPQLARKWQVQEMQSPGSRRSTILLVKAPYPAVRDLMHTWQHGGGSVRGVAARSYTWISDVDGEAWTVQPGRVILPLVQPDPWLGVLPVEEASKDAWTSVLYTRPSRPDPLEQIRRWF